MKFFNQIVMTMFVKKNKLKLKTLHFFRPKNNRSVILNIIKFSRLCGNMKLYVYDGTSVRSPLIAIYR